MLMFPKITPEKAGGIYAEAKRRGMITAMDISRLKNRETVEVLSPILCNLDYFFPNRYEASLLTGKSTVPEMADEFMKLYRRENGIEIVSVITAIELSDSQRDKLKTSMESKLGKKVILNETVDPAIVGGMVVRTESSQIDGSIRTRLDSIEKQIKSAVI